MQTNPIVDGTGHGSARRNELEKKLRYCTELPTLPTVALRIIELGNDPDVGIADVAKVIGLDPALSAKLLKTANSPLYGLRRRTHNLRQALSLLGLNATLTLALGFSLSTTLRSTAHPCLDTSVYWRRSIMAAVAARAIGEHQGMTSLEELFLAGLLQDIGMLALDSLLPGEYGQLVAGAADHDALVKAERETLGIDHAEVGVWLLRQWNLPDYLQLAVSGSNDPLHAQVPKDLLPIIPCVALSGRMADIWLHPEGLQFSLRAARSARQWLGIKEEGYHALLVTVSKALPEVLALFEMDPMDADDLNGILNQAKEILTLRNLRLQEDARETRRLAETLDNRTRRLEEQNHLDSLTGIYNRGHLSLVLAREFTNATERGWPLSVAFVDLDHFKKVNDTHGHHVGDQVLSAVARLLAANLRQTDVVARYGGEEFVVVLPGTGLDAAQSLLQRLLQVIREQDYDTDAGEPLRLTVSMGLACHMNAGQRFDSPEELLQAADQALYVAKREGRDRLVLYAD